jgi:hypothetical protein
VNLTAVIPIWNSYVRYWPRVWSELIRQVETGAPVCEVVITRPRGQGPTLTRLAEVFESVATGEAPRLTECPVRDSDPLPGQVRNAALERVSSELVAFIDVDNYLAPGIWRHLRSMHECYRGLGSAAANKAMRYTDGTIAPYRSRAYRLGRPAQLGPDRGWQQALLWRLSIETALLAPGGPAVHATSVIRECGGYGRSLMEDLVLGAASVSCASALYLPRLVGGLSEQRLGSLWLRQHRRSEIIASHDEMVHRLHWLAEEGRLRPELASRGRLMDRLLALQRRRLMRMVPPQGFAPHAGPAPGAPSLPSHPRLSAWLEGALRDERRMGELLARFPCGSCPGPRAVPA